MGRSGVSIGRSSACVDVCVVLLYRQGLQRGERARGMSEAAHVH